MLCSNRQQSFGMFSILELIYSPEKARTHARTQSALTVQTMNTGSQASDTHLFKGFKFYFELLQLPAQFAFLVQLMFLYIECLIQLIHQIPDI